MRVPFPNLPIESLYINGFGVHQIIIVLSDDKIISYLSKNKIKTSLSKKHNTVMRKYVFSCGDSQYVFSGRYIKKKHGIETAGFNMIVVKLESISSSFINFRTEADYAKFKLRFL